MVARVAELLIVYPTDRDFVTGFGIFQHEGEKRVFSNAPAQIAGKNEAAVKFYADFLNEMRGYQLTGFVAVTAVFHRMSDQCSDLGFSIQAFAADFDAGHFFNHRNLLP